ncbi:hypothetical protein DI494_22310, partial [Stenotrophomonas maltophilia]
PGPATGCGTQPRLVARAAADEMAVPGPAAPRPRAHRLELETGNGRDGKLMPGRELDSRDGTDPKTGGAPTRSIIPQGPHRAPPPGQAPAGCPSRPALPGGGPARAPPSPGHRRSLTGIHTPLALGNAPAGGGLFSRDVRRRQ